MRRIRVALTAFAVVVLAMGGLRARADAALLMEEPYAEFGAFNPTGHAAIYLNHVCAESPTRLRPCRAVHLTHIDLSKFPCDSGDFRLHPHIVIEALNSGGCLSERERSNGKGKEEPHGC